MFLMIHSAQYNLSKSEAESKYFIYFPILQPEQVILTHIWHKVGQDMPCLLILSFADFSLKYSSLLFCGFILFFKDLWKKKKIIWDMNTIRGGKGNSLKLWQFSL